MTSTPDQTTMKPRKAARQARSAATVEVIVEGAARILEIAGLAGFTTNAIADRAGVSIGSLYQYFPNKDSITRAIIRRELELLDAAIGAIDMRRERAPLSRFIEIAVDQQMRRPVLAQLIEIEEQRLDAGGDLDPVRERVAGVLTAILAAAGHRVDVAVVQDVMGLMATLVNAASSRGEQDVGHLVRRVELVVRARLEDA